MKPARIGAAVAALSLVLVGPAAAASAAPLAHQDTSDFSFESFDAQYYLDQDDSGHATTRVVETLVADFPDYDQNRGIIRALPLTDQDYDLDVHMVSITDENGTAVPYERDDYDGFAEFALGTDDFVHGRTTYVIEYTMANTIRNFSDTADDEFYWDVNGTGWAQSFGKVSVAVHVGAKLAAALSGNASCYAGGYGDTTECDIVRSGDDYAASATDLGPYSTLTVSIGFANHTVAQPQLPRDSWIVTLAPKLLLGLEALLVALAAVIRGFFWRDARGRGIIVAQYEPPQEGDLLLDANIVGRQDSGLQAQLVDFAVRGIIKVIDREPHGAAGMGKSRFAIELVSTGAAKTRELKVLEILFGKDLKPGKQVTPGKLSASIGASLYGLPAKTAAEALKEGYRAEVKAHTPKWLLRVSVFTILAFLAATVWGFVNDVLSGAVIWPLLGAIGLAVVLGVVLTKPKLLTEQGADARDYLLGMREYLTIAEEARLRVLQSPDGAQRIDVTDTQAVVKLNERLLGYAVLWGVEDKWAEHLRAAYPEGTSPDWFEGASFNASVLNSFTRTSVSSVRPIVATSTSGGGGSWSSSGGSSFSGGSSGGGFSGGGGGGGGGGGR